LLPLFSKPEAGGNNTYNDFHYQYAEDSMLVLHECIPSRQVMCLRCGCHKWTLWENSFHKNSWNNFHSRQNLRVAHTTHRKEQMLLGKFEFMFQFKLTEWSDSTYFRCWYWMDDVRTQHNQNNLHVHIDFK